MASSIILDKFTGDGFHPWQTETMYMLMNKDLWGLVNGDEKKERNEEVIKEWVIRDRRALANNWSWR